MSIPFRFHASNLSLVVDDDTYVRYGFVPAPAHVYGIDPAFGDLDLYLANTNGSVLPVAVSRTTGLCPPAGPTIVDGELRTVPVALSTPDGATRHISQAVILATGFSQSGPVPNWVHFNAVMGPRSMPRTHLLRLDNQSSPILLRTTANPPKPGTPVAVQAHLACYEVITEHGTFSILCLQGTARSLINTTSDQPGNHLEEALHLLAQEPSVNTSEAPETFETSEHPPLSPEDAVLYDDSSWLKALLAVPGVGPSAATMIMTSLGTTTIAQAVADKDAAILARVPGVGPKTAARIIEDIVAPSVPNSPPPVHEETEDAPPTEDNDPTTDTDSNSLPDDNDRRLPAASPDERHDSPTWPYPPIVGDSSHSYTYSDSDADTTPPASGEGSSDASNQEALPGDVDVEERLPVDLDEPDWAAPSAAGGTSQSIYETR